MVKGFSEWVNEGGEEYFNSLIMDKERWLGGTRVSFENAIDDGDIEEPMEEYEWNRYKEANESAWSKITEWLEDETPVWLELYNPPELTRHGIKDQRWQGIQDLMTRIEGIINRGNIGGTEVLDMLDTEPTWIPILTEIDEERIAVLVENSELGQLYGGGYALVPRRLVKRYMIPQLN